MADEHKIPFLPPPDRCTTRHKTKDGTPYSRQEITFHPAHDLNIRGLIQRYYDFGRTWGKRPFRVVIGWDIYESLVMVNYEQTRAMAWGYEFMGVPITVVSQEGFCEFVHEPKDMFLRRGAIGRAKE